MKPFALLATSLALISPVFADFFLVTETISTADGVASIRARAVPHYYLGNCDKMGSAESPVLDGAKGDTSYPWPETDFRASQSVCGAALRFSKNGNDYNVYDEIIGRQYDSCARGSGETKFCFGGLFNAEFSYDYECKTSWVCGG